MPIIGIAATRIILVYHSPARILSLLPPSTFKIGIVQIFPANANMHPVIRPISMAHIAILPAVLYFSSPTSTATNVPAPIPMANPMSCIIAVIANATPTAAVAAVPSLATKNISHAL